MLLVKGYSRDDISWSIGSLFAHDALTWKILRVCREIDEDCHIRSVFGSIPCIMQGGRIPPLDMKISTAKKVIDMYNSLNIACCLTFSNPEIEREDLDDYTSNQLLKIVNENVKSFNVNNSVIVTSDLLKTYIQNTYQDLKIRASILKPSIEVGLGRDNSDYYNSLLDLAVGFDTVNVNPFKLYESEFLSRLEGISRAEFVVNHRCLPNCPKAREHYLIQSKLGRKLCRNEKAPEEEKDLNGILEYCYQTKMRFPLAGTSYSISDIEYLISLGVRHFKIEGRECSHETFLRDLGDYIFEHNVFSRLSQSIMEEAV